MAGKKGRKDGMSESEYRRYLKEFRVDCPKESCDGYACFCDLGWAKYYQCNTCNKIFGYQDGRGSSISKAKYDALAERAKSRPAKSAGSSCPAEEDEMAKVTKKSKKKASKKSKKKSAAPAKKGPSVCAFVRAYATKNKKATVEQIAAALDKKHPGLTYSMGTVKAQAYRARKGLDSSGRAK